MAPDGTLALSKSQAEIAALRMAVYETVKNDLTLKVSGADVGQITIWLCYERSLSRWVTCLLGP